MKIEKLKIIKQNRGITLLNVVVVIVILIILAGVSINLLIGENGIITRAKKSREEQKIAELSEKLELVKAPTQVDKLDTIITIDEYLEKLQQPNAVDFSIDEIERVDEDNAYVTVADKYVFLVEYKEDKTLIITYQGKIEELKPRITKIELSNTTNSITAKVEAKRAEKYKFYIKEKIEGEYEYKEENKKGEYTYSNLEQNKEYYIKIEAINKNGQVESEVKRTTGGMPVLTIGELISTTTPEGWVNTNKTTKIEIRTDKDVTGVRLQYTKLPENATTEDYKKAQWINYTSNGIESEKNETIAIRLWDGTNETSRMAVKVEKIDKIDPVITEITANTNTITIKATDEASGIIGYTITENITEPTSFTSCTSTKSLDVNVGNKIQGKIYYVWVKDSAGNVSTYKQVGTTSVTPSVGNITFTYSTTNWTNKDIIVTANTTITGYKLQTSTDAKTWKDETSQTLSANGNVYARLADSTNQATGYAVAMVNKIDKVKPIVNIEGSTSGTIIVKATDNASGIIGYAITETESQPTEFTTCSNTKAFSKVFEDLKHSTDYYVWVKDAAGNINDKCLASTKDISDRVEYTIAPETWTNGTVKVTVSFPITGYTLKVRKTETATWSTALSQSYTANGTIYVQVTENSTGLVFYTQKDITNIDKTKPIITGVEDITFTTAKVKATDEASGLAKYGFSTSNTTPSASAFKDIENVGSLEAQILLTGLVPNKTYYVWVKDVAGNVSASYKFVMMTDKVKPIITGVEDITFTTAKVNATDEASGLAQYAFSTSNSTPAAGSFKNIENVGSLEAQILLTGLVPNKIYYVWVKDVAGNVSASYKFVMMTDTVKPIITGVEDITFTTAKVNATDEASGLAKYAFSTSNSTPAASAFKDIENVGSLQAQIQLTGLTHNKTYYVWVKDVAGNTSASSSFKTIQDTTLPTAIIEYDKSTTLTIEAKVTHIDNETGINISKCKWIYNQSSNALGTTASKYTGGTFKENGGIANYAINTASGEFYLHILTIDNAGNAKETISGPINVTPTSYHKHEEKCYRMEISAGNNCNNTSNLGFVEELNGESYWKYRCNDCGSEFTGTNGWHHCTASKHQEKKLVCGKTANKTIEECTITYP